MYLSRTRMKLDCFVYCPLTQSCIRILHDLRGQRGCICSCNDSTLIANNESLVPEKHLFFVKTSSKLTYKFLESRWKLRNDARGSNMKTGKPLESTRRNEWTCNTKHGTINISTHHIVVARKKSMKWFIDVYDTSKNDLQLASLFVYPKDIAFLFVDPSECMLYAWLETLSLESNHFDGSKWTSIASGKGFHAIYVHWKRNRIYVCYIDKTDKYSVQFGIVTHGNEIIGLARLEWPTSAYCFVGHQLSDVLLYCTYRRLSDNMYSFQLFMIHHRNADTISVRKFLRLNAGDIKLAFVTQEVIAITFENKTLSFFDTQRNFMRYIYTCDSRFTFHPEVDVWNGELYVLCGNENEREITVFSPDGDIRRQIVIPLVGNVYLPQVKKGAHD